MKECGDIREHIEEMDWLSITMRIAVLPPDILREYADHIMWDYSFVKDWCKIILKRRNLWSEFKHYYE